MDTKRISYTIYSLTAIFLTYSSCLAFSQQTTNTSILDVDGNQLQSNTKYYIFTPKHGGLALSIRDHRNPCPPNVMQENDEASIGLSLKIFPADKKQQEVSLYSDLNIVFMAATICVQRTVWQLGDADWITGRRYVRSDGVVGRPGAATVGNWFKMDRFGEGYKIVYCPSVCSTCKVDCGEVGVFVENGRRWLGLGGEPLVIVFKKVVNNSTG